MRSSPPFFWPFTCSIILLLSLCALVVSGKCLGSQQSLLLQLRNSLDFSSDDSNYYSDYSTKLVHWNESFDCCSWEGVTCEEGRVTHLNLSHEGIHGGLDNSSTLFDLQHLKSLDLSYNDFNSTIPSRIGSLTNLSYLNLAGAGSNLVIPNLTMLLHNLSKLQELYLDFANISAPGNRWCEALSSTVPNLQILSLSNCIVPGPLDQSLLELQSLTEIHFDGINFSSPVPQFFAEFSSLTLLNLGDCGLQGTFPSEIFQVPTLHVINLSFNELLVGTLPEFSINNSLQELDLAFTMFNGILPSSMSNLTQIVYFDLSSNNFTGPIPSFNFSTRLEWLDVSSNSLFGEIPLTLFTHPSLGSIWLSNNSLSGPIPEFKMTSSSLLHTLHLSDNDLEGLIPTSIFKLKNLSFLDLSYNKFNGTKFQGSSELYILDLSCNNLTSFPDLKSPSKLSELDLSYNSLKSFPDLENLSMLTILDLSYNDLKSSPILKNQSELTELYLSHNCLKSFSGLKNISSLRRLDLSYNQISGEIPKWISKLGKHSFQFLSKLEGVTVDLSHNNLSGRIPTCLIETSDSHFLLNLGDNNLEGPIPDVFPKGCRLKSLFLHGNFIEGEIPKSLANCVELELLHLGHNELIGEFPCLLKNIPILRVLILRSNKLYGSIECPNVNGSWPTLQIFDLADNNFSGELPRRWLTKLKAMMADGDNVHAEVLGLYNEIRDARNRNARPIIGYVYTEPVTSKGLEMELPKILTIFTYIDLSKNNFHGPIPVEFGQLKALHILNLSYNALGGQIPSSIGNMRNLESLDLSWNNLDGTIPTQLQSLNFLSSLNLSFNQLVGKIPVGGQLDTFSEDSYIGNRGLYGCPLTENCSGHKGGQRNSTKVSDSNSRRKINWNLLSAEMGLFTGFGLVVSPLMFSRRWRMWYYERVDDIIFKIFPLSVSRKWFLWTTT